MKKIIKKIRNIIFDTLNPKLVKVIKSNLTYLSKGALYNIYKSVKRIELNNIPGIFVETGCALGGSTILIGLTKSKTRRLNVYDVFGMIPPPTNNDGIDIHNRYEIIKEGKSEGINGELYYGYEQDLLNKVKQNLKKFGLTENDNISLIQGLYEETLKIDEPIAFAHIDCDWYSSVMTCLQQIEPNLSNGGIMIIDDYYDWSGCKKAIDKYFYENDRKIFFQFKTINNKLIIEKKKSGAYFTLEKTGGK